MTPQQLIRTILDAVAEDDLRKAEDAIALHTIEFNRWIRSLDLVKEKNSEVWLINYSMNEMSYFATNDNHLYELFTQQNKP